MKKQKKQKVPPLEIMEKLMPIYQELITGPVEAWPLHCNELACGSCPWYTWCACIDPNQVGETNHPTWLKKDLRSVLEQEVKRLAEYYPELMMEVLL